MTEVPELAELALDSSSADACVVLASASSTANLRWANNTLTTNGVMSSTTMTAISFIDTDAGRAVAAITRSVASPQHARELVADADKAARAGSPAGDAAELISGDADRSFADVPELTSIDAFSGFATELGEAFGAARSADRLLYGYVEHDVTTTYLASSTGLRRRHVQPTAQIGITGKTADLGASAWVGRAGEQVSELDVPSLTQELDRRLGWSRRKVALPAGRYDTIMPTTAVSDLMIYLYYVSSGRDASEGQTVFSHPAGGTRVGQQVASKGVRLSSDPSAAGIRACPFVVARASSSMESVFDNGAPLGRTNWIDDGVLRSLATSRYTAGLTGLGDAPPIDNLALTVREGEGGVDDLIRSTDRGLLLTCLWYIREVDPQTLLLTGLTRDGVYLVEDGEVVGAVNNFRFNESPLDLLNRFSASGATERSYSREWGDYFPRTAMPSLRIPDFNMSSVSQAN